MAAHPDEKGLVHAHSYAIQDRLAELLDGFGVDARVRTHDRGDRDAALEGWKASGDPEVFLAVKMEEALDLRGDLCRWQVLCKAPYLNTSDSRVARRLEEGQWSWYHRAALRTVIQACGRVVRAPDDYGATYLADASLVDLFDRARSDTPPWFAEQVREMSTPDLPEFDPAAALGGVGGGPDPGARRRGRGSNRKAGSGRSSTTSSPSSNDANDANDDHPLSDVWGE